MLHCNACQWIDDGRYDKGKKLLEQRDSIKRTCKQLIRAERCQLYTSGLGEKRPAMNNGWEQAGWKWFEARLGGSRQGGSGSRKGGRLEGRSLVEAVRLDQWRWHPSGSA